MDREHALVRFGELGQDGVRVSGAVTRHGPTLRLRYVIDRMAGAVVLPPPAPAPARGDGLWQRTCCEAFVATAGEVSYWEVNVAPSGDWNVYCFDAYRNGMRPAAESSVVSECVLDDPARFVLSATVTLGAPPLPLGLAVDVGLAVVVEHADGTRSYWALAHEASSPDFHHRDSFRLRLPPEGPDV